jgi:hypothetical protein
MTEEEPIDGILEVVGFGMLNVPETVMVIRIVDMTIVIAMVIAEDLEEIRMAMEREIGFPIDEVVIEIGILVAEVVLVHVGHMVLGQSMREKVVVGVDLEEEMIDLRRKVMIMALFILCVCW